MTEKYVFVMGYQPHEGIMSDDYTDFKPGSSFKLTEARYMARMGNFPPGIILQVKCGPPCVIRGPYGSEQYAEVLQP